jgi:argininosuccinate synthase
MAEKIVLAYSGGLDTTVAIRWLKESRGFEVIALTVDLGNLPELEKIKARAKASGAVAAHVEDQRRAFVENFCWPALRAGALYQGQYPLATALGRPLIAERLVAAAKREGAAWVAHGSTGKGNDQVRFDIAVGALAPHLKVLAPLRDGMSMTREQEVAYAREHNLPIQVKAESPYSIDENLWGRSIEAGVLEDANQEAPEDAFLWTEPVENAPEGAEYLAVDFEQGIPVSIDGKGLDPVSLVEQLNRRGGAHGVGRIDMIEDRFVGIKSREVYEAPAAVILHLAHQGLEDMVVDAEAARFKSSVAAEYARLTYQGKWFTSHRRDLDAYVASTQVYVTGQVRIKLHKGTARVVSRNSIYSLYRPQLATYSQGDQFDHQAAVGFIKLVGLPIRTQARVQTPPTQETPPD